jgi:hypothetical protein
MSRLLFAAARGARIEALDKNLGWILSSHCPLAMSNDTRPYRIHPDDEHLAYGPVSTALREMAAYPPSIVEIIFPVQRHYLNVYKYSDEMYMWADDLHKSLMLLLVAEALVDEGM